MLKLAEIVAASQDVAATRSRKQKTERLAKLLARLEPDEVRPTIGFLRGDLRQGKLGVGYRVLQQLPGPSASVDGSVTVSELDAIFQEQADSIAFVRSLYEQKLQGERDDA